MTISSNGDGSNTIPPLNFDLDFATPSDFAGYYRACGWQVVPAWAPGEREQWKSPRLQRWKHLQPALADEPTYLGWYGPNGDARDRLNMGLFTGPCSGNRFVLDLDLYKTPACAAWWRNLIDLHNNGLELETVEQVTGGGGLQKVFLAPVGVAVPTFRSDIGVDVRGQGGFAMLAPSLHESGRHYAWAEGRAPWETEVALAPQWLLDAIGELGKATVGKNPPPPGGGSSPRPPPADGAGPTRNAFGKLIDGREQYMANLVFAAVVGLRMENPIGLPPDSEMEAVWADYERNCAPLHPVAGESNAEGLEREGRGHSLFAKKWRDELKDWDGKIAYAAMARAEREKAEKPEPRPKVDPATGAPLPLLLTSKQFIAGFVPPSYLVDGVILCGTLYAVTGRTNAGKTAVAMYVASCVARGVPMHGREVKVGTVLFLAGENPQDIRSRFLVLSSVYDFDPKTIKIRFIDGVIDLKDRMDEIRAEAATIDDLVMVIVDTAAAYFPGDDSNNNSQQGDYARLLRELTQLRGRPAVWANCHPVKNAARDNLLPMGGSAFLNEIDGNLTLWANAEKQASMHWQGKFRGPEFEPLAFELAVASSDLVADAKGRLMPSVVAKAVSESAIEAGERVQEADENKVMFALAVNPRASFTVLANKCGFVIDGRLQKTKVHRVITRLVEDKLAVRHRGRYVLTDKGKKEIGFDD